MPGLRFDHVWKVFSEDAVGVEDLSLEITEGEFLVLVGPSGCGKTTSLRMLAGLERPSHGRIFDGDTDITDKSPGDRDASMVFQSYALYPNMSVYDNLAFGPKVRKDSKEEIARRISEVAKVLDIEKLLKRRPGELSGGQRQRVALGRAMIRQPRIFLMDEPLSNLDAALRVQMRAELIKLHRGLEQTTTVYVTHDQIEALTMGDRVAVMRGGRLMQVDTPARLFAHPANAFVAGFIGSPKMNLVAGTVTRADGGARLSVFGRDHALPASVASRLSPTGSDVLVGVRPGDLRTAEEMAGAELFTVDGVIEVAEHTGTEVFVTVDAGGGRLVGRMVRHARPEVGERVTLGCRLEDLYLFDATTEESLLAPSSN